MTPKVYQLHKFNDFLGLDLPHKEANKDCSLGSNAWQAGFIDADGNFTVTYEHKGLWCLNFYLSAFYSIYFKYCQ